MSEQQIRSSKRSSKFKCTYTHLPAEIKMPILKFRVDPPRFELKVSPSGAFVVSHSLFSRGYIGSFSSECFHIVSFSWETINQSNIGMILLRWVNTHRTIKMFIPESLSAEYACFCCDQVLYMDTSEVCLIPSAFSSVTDKWYRLHLSSVCRSVI